MDIESAQLVRYDFYQNASYEEVVDVLHTLFGTKVELPEQTVDFGDREIDIEAIHFSNPEDELTTDKFDSLHTYLVQDTESQYFCHQLTIATLATTELDRIIPGDVTANRSCRTTWYNEIKDITRTFPPSLIQESASRPLLLLVNPSQDELKGFSTNSVEQITEFLQENASELDGWGFDLLSDVTLLNSSYLITETESLSSPLPILNINYSGNPLSGNGEYWEQWFEFEYRKLKPVTNLFLATHWLAWRKSQIQQIDSESYNYSMDSVKSGASVEEVSETEEDLEALRKEWVETHSSTADEYQEVQSILENYQLSKIHTVFDRSLEEQSETYLASNVRRTTEKLDALANTLDRVGKKLEMFTTVVQDRIQSRATKSNLQLQNSVRNLTILLAIIAIVEFLLDYVPPTFVESASVTITVKSFAFILALAILLGFFHGFAHK